MQKEKKTQSIDMLRESFTKCAVGIMTDYRGLSTAEITQLRHKLRESGIEYKVVKNTLDRFAAEGAGRDDLLQYFKGPVAIAFGYGNIIEPAKALTDFIRVTRTGLSIEGGFLDESILTAEDVKTLSKLPAREVLLAMVLGSLGSPITAFVNCLAAPIRGVTGVLQARIQQLEGE
jgi:large subunit ribosomal protein L10